MLKNIFYLFATLFCIVLLNACVPRLTIEANSNNTINPDESGNALPVLIKIVQLRDQTSFNAASFDDLWMNQQAVLGDSLLSEDEMTVLPNSQKTLRINYLKHAKYIGFIAIFRTHQHNSWRSIEKITGFTPLGRRYVISLSGNNLTIENGARQ